LNISVNASIERKSDPNGEISNDLSNITIEQLENKARHVKKDSYDFSSNSKNIV
jgi:hypothetical protein